MRAPDIQELLRRTGCELVVERKGGRAVLSLSRYMGGRGASEAERRFVEENKRPITEFLKRKADYERAEAELSAKLRQAVGQK
jgi:hypothetical protein